MEINLVGVAAALATFLGVWMGHVAVRKIERETIRLWIPICVALALGVGCGVFSFLTSSLTLSAMSGIFAMTLFWDGFEFLRQQKRVRHGHAPANPKNPRHAKILAEYPSATTIDWLDRDPRGRKYSSDELTSIWEGQK
jgi:uncharacterized membrane protein YfcA